MTVIVKFYRYFYLPSETHANDIAAAACNLKRTGWISCPATFMYQGLEWRILSEILGGQNIPSRQAAMSVVSSVSLHVHGEKVQTSLDTASALSSGADKSIHRVAKNEASFFLPPDEASIFPPCLSLLGWKILIWRLRIGAQAMKCIKYHFLLSLVRKG